MHCMKMASCLEMTLSLLEPLIQFYGELIFSIIAILLRFCYNKKYVLWNVVSVP